MLIFEFEKSNLLMLCWQHQHKNRCQKATPLGREQHTQKNTMKNKTKSILELHFVVYQILPARRHVLNCNSAAFLYILAPKERRYMAKDQKKITYQLTSKKGNGPESVISFSSLLCIIQRINPIPQQQNYSESMFQSQLHREHESYRNRLNLSIN